MNTEKADRLYIRGLNIRDLKAVGRWVPIMQHLALRGHTGAMIELANWFSEPGTLASYGKTIDSGSAAGLYCRAFRKGDPIAALNMAVGSFNQNDLAGYRRWLRRAAVLGDDHAAKELLHFETRLWHRAAFKIRRGRPFQKRDDAV